MRKTTVTGVIFLMLALIVVTGCTSSYDVDAPFIDGLIQHPLVGIEIDQSTVTATDVRFAMFNNTEQYIEMFDPDFWLERRERSGWVAVQPIRERQGTLGASFLFPPGETSHASAVMWNFPLAAQPYYGVLPPGEYRLVLVFPLADGLAYAADEFAIQ
jgi:hypothetical protein